MEQDNTLSHLLEVEAAAAALVKDAQEEADKRIRENEEKSRIAYEDRCKKEIHTQESLQIKHKEEINKQYKDTLDEYCLEISKIPVNNDKFAALLNEYLENQ